MSSCTRNPSGPVATLVVIPKNVCVGEGVGGFLGFLSNIFVLVAKRKPKQWTHNAKPHAYAHPSMVTERIFLCDRYSVSVAINQAWLYLCYECVHMRCSEE
ncbi:hypothetical protein BDM02DRAFT_2211066 [Thelephora ganbajun]|uniref:Uncharacterized protein n=1 Tax=Thelephora ganbajun TaxID=370292 RepID=A0ACB6YZ73_THEGA|nr:hypothetical protein BDM02DRAFT_2211066 [Thelephora ganbajun]